MPEVMSVSGRKAIETWHAQQTGTFDFAEELVAYCESDVKLLKEGCLKFKQLFEEKSKFNPFSCMTIASSCNRDLRQNRMEPKPIASEPLHGWRLDTNHSHVSLEWSYWEDSKLNRIQHARNKGEFRIPKSNYTGDGYDEVTKTVYEFQGCVVVFMGVANAIPTTENRIAASKTAAWKMCTSAPNVKSWV